MVSNLVRSARNLQSYILTIAYGIVTYDLIYLALEIAVDYIDRSFDIRKEKKSTAINASHNPEKVENDLEHLSEFEKSPETSEVFNEMVIISNGDENITKLENVS